MKRTRMKYLYGVVLLCFVEALVLAMKVFLSFQFSPIAKLVNLIVFMIVFVELMRRYIEGWTTPS